MREVTVDDPERWAQVCSDSFVPLCVDGVHPAFHARLRQRRLADGVSATRVWTDPSDVVRSPRLTRTEPRDDVLLSLQLRGVGSVHQHGRVARLRPGQGAIYEASAPYRLSFAGRMSQLVLQVPRTALDGKARLADRTAVVLQADASSAALAGLLARLTASEEAADRDGLHADAAAALLRGLVAGPADAGRARTPPSRAVLRLAALDRIARRFTDPAFDAAALARECGVSVRFLQLAFEAAGETPAAVLRAHRLDNARARLLDGAAVAAAAEGAGFLDPGTFTRAFKRRFGATPAELRAWS